MLWHPDLDWFPDAPATPPVAPCSWCGRRTVRAREAVTLRSGAVPGEVLRFHPLCFAYVVNAADESLLFEDVDDLLLHWRATHA